MKRLRNFLVLITAIMGFAIVNVSAQKFAIGKSGQERTIEQQIFKKLIGLPRYGVFDIINYEVRNGTVILGGKVNSLGTKRDAASVVKRIPGVVDVVNNIVELPPSSFDDRIRRQALRTFASNGLYQYFWEVNPEVRIIVENGHITLEGFVSNSGDYNRLNIYANGITGVFSVKNNLVVGSPR